MCTACVTAWRSAHTLRQVAFAFLHACIESALFFIQAQERTTLGENYPSAGRELPGSPRGSLGDYHSLGSPRGSFFAV